MNNILSEPLKLPCGAKLSNRLCKAAMSEGMAGADHHSTPRLETLYRRWAGSGAGLLLSGNIQVDRWHLERPLNLVVDGEGGMTELAKLAAVGRSHDSHFWAQLNHAGRQTDAAINPAPLAPSNVEVDVIRGTSYLFAPPRAMTETEIEHAIAQFAFSARKVREAGFTGVQLHAAHGYLISQFLSPLSNRRADGWGGSLEHRSRFLIQTLAAVRGAVGADFPIGIKLNASDFQKGGFTNAECLELVKVLNTSSLDLLELSGGSLEQPKIVGVAVKDEGEDKLQPSTVKREAYFVDFAGAVRAAAAMPVMVTGGFRTVTGMVEALERGELDLIGLGRPLIADPQTPKRLLTGEIDRAPAPEAGLNLFHLQQWNNMQLERLGDGLDPDLTLDSAWAATEFAALEKRNTAAVLELRR
ncbi:NADH:flavin oxidoreductase/NADH oxidase family protein [Bradyrhizobium sp. 200]|uniref:NADH:flavin oxidoreductase/NADH oxidase family protein n=1 Tax=Bradyrhizobium sp. 200 TaxID=2782665 RepID=UPI001FFF4695|nr:NADH:flavin oxidoreductase/NADH oxidase family protein [Bradyrhizobium sp. 200]UPJ48325.1 NADH:flavin oxidoreductase/NADH oxidase family protein [Bradyrhizobium sp. 200]